MTMTVTSPRAHLRQQPLQQQALVRAAFERLVRLRAEHQRAAPEGARLAPGSLVAEPRAEGMRHFLLARREVRLDLRKDLGLVLVVAELAAPAGGGDGRIARAV